jgi:hypothetical protein
MSKLQENYEALLKKPCFAPCPPFKDFCNHIRDCKECEECMVKYDLVDYIE